jgi:hypothetical protein
MDADGRDDIIYITSAGELGILYGSSVAGTFVKKILDPTLGITLSPTPTTVGGAIHTSTSPILSPLPSSNDTGLDESILR